MSHTPDNLTTLVVSEFKAETHRHLVLKERLSRLRSNAAGRVLEAVS